MKINFIQNVKNLYHRPLVKNRTKYRPTKFCTDTFEKMTELSFKGVPCTTRDFLFKYYPYVHCACCGKETLSPSQISELTDKTGEELCRALEKYDNYYEPFEKQVVDELKKYAPDYPDLNIARLVKQISIGHRESLVKEQTSVIEKLRMSANLINDNAREIYIAYLDATAKIIKNFNDESNYDTFKRKSFINNLELYVTGNTKNEDDVDTILNIAEKMPTSESNINAFFIKYSRRSQLEIANRLLCTVMSTTEHVKPQERGGEDNTANYIIMCGECNGKRGSKPYGDWFKTHPEMPSKNIDLFLDDAEQIIKETRSKDYETYIDEVLDSIEEEGKLTDEILSAMSPEELKRHSKKKKEENEEATETQQNIKASLQDPSEFCTTVDDDSIQDEIPEDLTKAERIQFINGKKQSAEKELEALKQRKEELADDSEYQNLLKYSKMYDEIILLERKRKEASDKLRDEKKEQDKQHSHIVKAEEIRCKLGDPALSNEEKKNLKNRLQELEQGIEKRKNVDEKVQKAENELQTLDKRRKELEQSDEYRVLIRFFNLYNEILTLKRKSKVVTDKLAFLKTEPERQGKRIKEANGIQCELDKSNMPSRHRNRLEGRLKDVKKEIEKHKDYDQKISETEAELKEIMASITQKEEEFERLTRNSSDFGEVQAPERTEASLKLGKMTKKWVLANVFGMAVQERAEFKEKIQLIDIEHQIKRLEERIASYESEINAIRSEKS